MKLLSNGFFLKNVIGIDYNEEMEFTEINNNDEINIMLNDYSFDINDLRDLKAVDEVSGKEVKNILKDYFISNDEYEIMALNYYIIYSRKDNLMEVVVSIYDIDNGENEYNSLIEFIRKLKWEVSIIINTDEEKEKILEMINDYCKHWCYVDIDDFYNKEYDSYLLEEKKEYLVDKRDVIQEIKNVAENGEWVDENELYNMILNSVRNIKRAF